MNTLDRSKIIIDLAEVQIIELEKFTERHDIKFYIVAHYHFTKPRFSIFINTNDERESMETEDFHIEYPPQLEHILNDFIRFLNE